MGLYLNISNNPMLREPFLDDRGVDFRPVFMEFFLAHVLAAFDEHAEFKDGAALLDHCC